MILVLAVLAGCASYPLVEDPSVNAGSRIRQLVLHFTSEDFAESRRLLTQRTANPVSAHYLVPAPGGADGDPSYPARRVVVHRLVPEARRAWHAGRSQWRGETALNNSSIGIEIVNLSRCEPRAGVLAVAGPEDEDCRFLPYPEAQLAVVIALAQDILARHPDIAPWNVVGHADIAPTRKVDPGPLFPWARLHQAGIGAWYEEETVARYRARFEAARPSLAMLQAALAAWGHAVDVTGEDDARSRYAVRAFQMHFRPRRHDGVFDAETAAILHALLERYHPEALAALGARAAPGPFGQD
jgi:N-acetyl-anhydromuramyl-L-alanine amidase AmpD